MASKSPRREKLFREICPNFEIIEPITDEAHKTVRPHAVVKELARLKAQAAISQNPDMFKEDTVVIAADTVVALDGMIYPKPRDEKHAFDILSALSGKTHFVYTGVCMRDRGAEIVFYDKSAVKMKALSEEEINAYIKAFHPFDKAGAYGIQDGQVVESYAGSYANIMGFPTEIVKQKLNDEFNI